jgi:hypothetical protein
MTGYRLQKFYFYIITSYVFNIKWLRESQEQRIMWHLKKKFDDLTSISISSRFFVISAQSV